LIGRSEEIQAIKQSFEAASNERQLHAMLVCGEAGLGKRKLLADFDEYLGRLPELVLHAFVESEPNDRHVPFGAAARLLRYRFAVGLHDSPETARERIRAFVVHAFSRWQSIEVTAEMETRIDEVVDLIARIPGIAGPGIQAPQTREETLRVFEAVTEVFVHISEAHPVVLAIHGAGHLDRLSRDLFEFMALHLLDRPIFCLTMSRTPAIALQTPNTMRLRPLDLEGVQHQINILLKGRPSTELLDLIFRKAGGNPFQITEFVRFLHISGLLIRQRGRWSVDYDDPRAEELDSMSVEDVTLAELRSLPPETASVLKSAAVCGRAFWRGQVGSVYGHDAEDALLVLVEHEVLAQQPFSRFAGESEYAFRSHAMQSVLYRQLSDEDRRAGHRKAAAWLANVSEGGLPDKARMARHLLAAGDEAEAEVCRRALSDQAALWEGVDGPGWYDWPRDT
ncbi:MAG: AAA family ATPase, partial [Myxococcota bacterium]|nr:AAA family ATPase [Myxococcota bacterium]